MPSAQRRTARDLQTRLMNAGQFFEAHEELELAWRAETRTVRELYRGFEQRLVRADTGETQGAQESGFDEAQTAGRDGDHAEERGDDVREQHHRGAWLGADGRKGDELPRIPKWTGDFSVQYERGLEALPDWSAWVRSDWSYHGKSATELRPTAATYRVQHSYDITNFRVGATNARSGLDVALFVENVFDTRGDVFLIAATATRLAPTSWPAPAATPTCTRVSWR